MTLLLHFLFLPLHFLAFCLLLWLWVSTFHNTSARIISLGPLLLRYSELWNPFTAPCRRHFYCSGLPELSHINWQSSYCFLFPLFGFDFNFFSFKDVLLFLIACRALFFNYVAWFFFSLTCLKIFLLSLFFRSKRGCLSLLQIFQPFDFPF